MAGKTENLIAALGNPAALKKHAASYFKEADANGDGSISHDEAVNIIRAISFRYDFPMPLEDKVMALVRKCDKSNDGSLQPDEWQLFFKVLVGSALQHRSKQEAAAVPAAEAPAPATEAAPTAAAQPTNIPTKKSTIGTFLASMAAQTQSATASVKGPCFVCAAPRRAAKAGA